jgi:hypothetical protein
MLNSQGVGRKFLWLVSVHLQRLRNISESLRTVEISEVWYFKYKLQGFENTVLREFSGPEMNGGNMKWWILYIKELCGLCRSPSVVMLVKCRMCNHSLELRLL